jgi:hypothetical protein
MVPTTKDHGLPTCSTLMLAPQALDPAKRAFLFEKAMAIVEETEMNKQTNYL